MTIKSDRWIHAQCVPPTHLVQYRTGSTEYAHTPFTPTQQSVHTLSAFMNEQLIANPNDTPQTHHYDELRSLTDAEIAQWQPMIHPYVPKNVREDNGRRILSYGLSSYGYDVRLANTFKLFTNINATVIDPLVKNNDCYVDMTGDYCIIPPNSYLLGHTVEYFRIPRNVMVLCTGKSTLARLGLLINITPIEPEFEGNVVIEISNATNLPVKVYANQGVAQFLFFQSDEPCSVSYKDRNGKYQGQTGITVATV